MARGLFRRCFGRFRIDNDHMGRYVLDDVGRLANEAAVIGQGGWIGGAHFRLVNVERLDPVGDWLTLLTLIKKEERQVGCRVKKVMNESGSSS